MVAADLRAATDPAERIDVNLSLFEGIIADPTPKSRRSYPDTSGWFCFAICAPIRQTISVKLTLMR